MAKPQRRSTGRNTRRSSTSAPVRILLYIYDHALCVLCSSPCPCVPLIAPIRLSVCPSIHATVPCSSQVKRKRKDPPPVTGTADVLDTDAAPSTATAPPPTPEGTGPGLEARVEELDAIYFFIAPCGALNSIERARSPNVTLKWARDEDRYCAYFCSSEKILARTVLHLYAADLNYEHTTPP